jgi:hypothetical protein
MQSEPPKRNRRWFQFSLRTLLIFTMICAVACGWLGKKIERKRKELDAAEAILRSGGSVWYDYQMEHGNEKPPGPDWLRGLLGENFFSEVENVQFGSPGTTVSDDAMAKLKELVELKTLYLANTKFSEASLVNLEALTHLQELSLGMTEVTDTGLEHLKRLTELKSLYLYQTGVTDSGLASLKGLTKLQNLDLRMTKISDAGLSNLKGLMSLQTLDLGLTDVSDAAIADLRKALSRCSFQWGRLW